MGNSITEKTHGNTSRFSQQFLSRIQKVSSEYSQKFGNYWIYQLQQKPYDYYIEYIETSISNSQTLKKKLKFYQNIPKNKNLVNVEYAEIVRGNFLTYIQVKELCAEFDGLRLFCMYYNFTLEEAIKVKIRQKSTFSEGELVYILRSLLGIGNFYLSQLKANCYSGIYQSKQVFISPQGHLKVYPFNQNFFMAFAQNYQNLIELQQNDQISKYSIGLVDKSKEIFQISDKKMQQCRSENGFSRSGLSRTQSGIKRSKLTTTLASDVFSLANEEISRTIKFESPIKDYLSSANSQKYLQEKNEQVINKLQRQQEHQQQENTNRKNLNQKKKQLQRDNFELGLLMMQLILLNQSHYYYMNPITQISLTSLVDKSKSEKKNATSNIYQNNSGSHLLKNNPRLIDYHDQHGRVPNVDLIEFSLLNLLPKKSISSTIINIIQKLILSSQKDTPNPNQLLQTVESFQEMLKQPKYCLRLDPPQKDQENSENCSQKYSSHYTIKKNLFDPIMNNSLDPFIKTTSLSSPIIGSSDSYFQSHINSQKLICYSKESFLTPKLEQLLNTSILTKSMIGQGQNKSTQILNNLKKSRKLIANKIRSVSTKGKEKTSNTEQISSQNYGITFG